MTLLLLGVAAYTILGGMVSVLITDYLQFIVMSVGLLIVTIMIFVKVGWDSLVEAVQKQHGAGGFSPFLGANGAEPHEAGSRGREPSQGDATSTTYPPEASAPG